ncbi:MAG TPA: chemotaxis protein CheA, partial [Nitrospirota bacterium]
MKGTFDMTAPDEQWNNTDMLELRKVFFAQAFEIADELEDAMLKLEADSGDEDVLKTVKRHVHTLKGDSNTIGLSTLGSLCHRMEDVLAVLLEDHGGSHEALELLMACVEAMYGLLVKQEAGEEGANADELLAKIESFLMQAAPPTSLPGLSEYEQLEVRTARADVPAGGGKTDGCGNDLAYPAHRTETLRIDVARVDLIMDLVGELIIGRSMVEDIMRELQSGTTHADAVAKLFGVNSYLERTVSDLQKGVMKMRMVPVNQVFRKVRKMVRDLARDRRKHIKLELQGVETELDKGLVDSLGEPLAHIIRNIVDHGIEGPGKRRSAGKCEEGTITLRAYHEAAQIVIEANDDGRGIDVEKLRQKAAAEGYISAEEAGRMSDAEAVNLVFHSGLSTAGTITETSGRGVGMAAVKSAVEAMKGSIEIESAQGRGTKFRMRIPLTLAVIRALLFEVGSRLYAVPVAAIAEVARIMTPELTSVDGRRTLVLRDQVVSVLSLEELFCIEGNGERKKFLLLLAGRGKRVGLMIDRILWQQEIVIKAVGGGHSQSELIAGASILGNGKVVLIVDVAALYRKAVNDERR